MANAVSLWMSLRFGQLEVNLSCDEVSGYAPDVVADMAKHTVAAFTDSIAELRGHGIIGTVEDEDDEVEDDE